MIVNDIFKSLIRISQKISISFVLIHLRCLISNYCPCFFYLSRISHVPASLSFSLAPHFFSFSSSLSLSVSPHAAHSSQPPSYPRSQSYLPAILPNYSSHVPHIHASHAREYNTRFRTLRERNMVKKISRSTRAY